MELDEIEQKLKSIVASCPVITKDSINILENMGNSLDTILGDIGDETSKDSYAPQWDTVETYTEDLKELVEQKMKVDEELLKKLAQLNSLF